MTIPLLLRCSRRTLTRFPSWTRYCSSSSNAIATTDLSQVPLERIRNFSIIAHVDHGKSTFADRILEEVGAIDKDQQNKQILDKLQVERERGITVKAQTASIIYNHKGTEYLLNLIDTPGHVDFSSEVSRSLSACQGVILLVDANQGVQAQTVSNFYLAFGNDLVILPVLNKIDLPKADPEGVKEQMKNLFDIEPETVLEASAKIGLGVVECLEAVIERIPPPKEYSGKDSSDLVMLLQDCWYDRYKGVVNLVQVVNGKLKINDPITSVHTGKSYKVKTVGILTPHETTVPALYPGQVGFFTCSMKTSSEAVAGDTYHRKDFPVGPLLKISTPQPMVFAGFYPFDATEHSKLRNAIEKTALNDSSVKIDIEASAALGQGWRLGFLGVLHMEVFSQRLEQEYNASVIITTPSVPYLLTMKPHMAKKLQKSEIQICNPAEWLDKSQVDSYLEPVVKGTLIAPNEYQSAITSLCEECRGEPVGFEMIDQNRFKMEYLLPMNEIVTDFFDDLKQCTSGYGSFDYEDAGYKEGQLVKIDILLNSKPIEELSVIVHGRKAKERSKVLVGKLKEFLPRQQFEIAIQAAVGKKVIARETLKPFRKNVTAKCYGGDLTRKNKLLARQKEGKKRMKAFGKIEISKDTFVELLKKK